MAKMDCVICNKTYLEQYKKCPHCNRTVERQLLDHPDTPFLIRTVEKQLLDHPDTPFLIKMEIVDKLKTEGLKGLLK